MQVLIHGVTSKFLRPLELRYSSDLRGSGAMVVAFDIACTVAHESLESCGGC